MDEIVSDGVKIGYTSTIEEIWSDQFGSAASKTSITSTFDLEGAFVRSEESWTFTIDDIEFTETGLSVLNSSGDVIYSHVTNSDGELFSSGVGVVDEVRTSWSISLSDIYGELSYRIGEIGNHSYSDTVDGVIRSVDDGSTISTTYLTGGFISKALLNDNWEIEETFQTEINNTFALDDYLDMAPSLAAGSLLVEFDVEDVVDGLWRINSNSGKGELFIINDEDGTESDYLLHVKSTGALVDGKLPGSKGVSEISIFSVSSEDIATFLNDKVAGDSMSNRSDLLAADKLVASNDNYSTDSSFKLQALYDGLELAYQTLKNDSDLTVGALSDIT